MGKTATTYRPFTWCLIDERLGPKPKKDAKEYWHGGNGRYNAQVGLSGAYVIYKTRTEHKEGHLELMRGLALNVATAKDLIDDYVKNLM